MNRAAGLTGVAGAVGLGLGAVLPWATISSPQYDLQTSTPSAGIDIGVFHLGLPQASVTAHMGTDVTYDGFTMPPEVIRVFIGSALLALLLSYALALRHKRRGLLLRLPLLIVGLAAGCLAGVLLYDFYDFMPLVTNSSYKIRVLPGLYLLLVSSLVVVIAAFVPPRHIPASDG